MADDRDRPRRRCGLLGYWWGARGSRVAGALIALPFLVEPVVYLFGLNTRIFPAAAFALYPGNLLIWAAELVVGLVLLWWLVVRARPPTEVRAEPSR